MTLQTLVEFGVTKNGTANWCMVEKNSTPLLLGIARSNPGTELFCFSFSVMTPAASINAISAAPSGKECPPKAD